MDWTAGFGWWTTTAAPRADIDASDRADMGTAFGLDASLVPWDDEGVDAAPEAAPEPAWHRRLVRRSEP